MVEIIRTRWLNFRRKRFWVLSAVLLYALLGFFVAPRVVENNIVALLEEDLGRVTRIENVDVNPFTLSLKIQGFELDDKDKTRLPRLASFLSIFSCPVCLTAPGHLTKYASPSLTFLWSRYR